MSQPQFQLNYPLLQTQTHTIDSFHKQAINTNEYEFSSKKRSYFEKLSFAMKIDAIFIYFEI